MTGSTYRLSHDEQQALKQRMLATLRVLRLKEVRAQDRQLAKQRARVFQELRIDSAQQLQAQLVALITQQREQELACLKEQCEEASAGLAAGQQQAAETEQQRALQAQLKHQLYLERQAEAQQRFDAALAQVRTARQSELQAVLDKVQRRQQIMGLERSKARGFADAAREAAASLAQQQAQLSLQEEQRRRQNHVSRIDFRYSRLHDLGMPHLVVNHRELPQEAADAASRAQAEAARLQAEQQAQAQQQQENARRAADRGVNAQKLLQAEHNRRRMEQALQQLEGNQVQQRQRDLSPDKVAAAPLLRKWQKQKLQAQAHRAFERDFLPGPGPQQGLPSFIAVATRSEAAEDDGLQQEQQSGRSSAHQAAVAADRALKLVHELDRQRRAEAAAAAAEQEQRVLRQHAATRAVAAAAAAAAAPSTTADSEVPVDDLITFIPPVSASSSQQVPETAPAAADQTAYSVGAAAAVADAPVSAAKTVAASSVDSLQELLESPALSTAPAVTSPPVSGPVVAAPAEPSGPAQQQLGKEAMQEDSSVMACQLSDEVAGGSASSSELPAEGSEAAVLSSRDSLDAIIAAADDVLRQLPADMQAAAAARAAAAAAPTLRGPNQGAPARSRQQQQQREATASARPGLQEPVVEATSGDSSSEAAAILAELRTLQQQLGLQVLETPTSDSALAELDSFDAFADRLIEQQLLQQPSAAPPAATAAREGAAAVARASSVGLSEALARAKQQLQAIAEPLPEQQQASQLRTDLDDLIDHILAPEFPSNILQEPLAGPVPSASSPTRSRGRAGRQPAAPQGERRQQAGHAAPAAAGECAPTAAPGAAAHGDSELRSAELLSRLSALGLELRALGLQGATEVSGSLDSSRGGSVVSSTVLPPAVRASLGDGSSSLTLPSTILEATAAALRQQRATQQLLPLPTFAPRHRGASATAAAAGEAARQQSASVSTWAPSLSMLLDKAQLSQAAPAAAGHPGAAAAAPGGRGLVGGSVFASLDSSAWSLSASQEESLLTLEQLLRAEAPGAAAAASARGSNTAAAVTSTVQAQARADAEGAASGRSHLQQQVPQGQAMLRPGPPSSTVSLPTTLQLGHTAEGAAGAVPRASQAALDASAGQSLAELAAAAAAAAEEEQGLDSDTYAFLQELLSLSDSSSSSSSDESPSSASGPASRHGRPSGLAAGVAAAAGGAASTPGLSVTDSTSSALSSMSDRELEQLLQRAMAGLSVGADAAADAAGANAAGAAASMGAADGAMQLSSGVKGSTQSIEAVLEAMLAAAGPAAATAPQQGSRLPFDQHTASTSIPSTVLRTMQPLGGASGGAPAPAFPAAASGAAAAVGARAGGSSLQDAAAAALQRAKHSSRVRTAETPSASNSSGAASAAASGSKGDGSPGDTGAHVAAAATAAHAAGSVSDSSGNLSLPQTLHFPASGDAYSAAGFSQPSSAWHGCPDGTASSLAAAPVAGSSISSFSLPSTVQHTMGALMQPTLVRQQQGQGQQVTAALTSTALDQQQQQQAGLSGPNSAALLAPIQEEGEASTLAASELSESTQEIDALLARLAHERSGQGSSSGSSTPGDLSGGDSSSSAGDEAGAHAASGGSSAQDVTASSDSFSEVVSSLVLHIDSTIASLEGSMAARPAAPAAAAGAGAAAAAVGSGGGSGASRQQQGSRHRSAPQPGAAAGAAAGSRSAPFQAAPADASAGAAGGFNLSSSLDFSRISSDTPTDSSTQHYVQQVLAGVTTSSAAATETTSASLDQDTPVSRQQAEQQPRGPAAAAVIMAAAVQGDRDGSSSRRGLQQGARAQGAQPAGGQQQQPHSAEEPPGTLLSPESTGSGATWNAASAGEAFDRLSDSAVLSPEVTSAAVSSSSSHHVPAGAMAASARSDGRSGGRTAAHGSRAAAAVKGLGMQEPRAREADAIPAAAQQQQQQQQEALERHRPQQAQSQQRSAAGRPYGLAGLLADIVADDPVLLQQLQQQQQQGGSRQQP